MNKFTKHDRMVTMLELSRPFCRAADLTQSAKLWTKRSCPSDVPNFSPALRASIGDDERQKETQHWEHHRDDLIHSVVATVSKIQIYDEVVPKFRFCRLSQETGLGLIGDIAHRDVADSCKSCSESHQVSRVFSVRIGLKSSVPWTSNGIFRKSRVSCNE